MINKPSKGISICALVIWCMQASFALANSGLVAEAEMLTQQTDHHYMNSAAPADTTSCHTGSDFPCDTGHCAACHFIISTELDDLTMVVDVVRLTNQLASTPQYISYRFYHPPH